MEYYTAFNKGNPAIGNNIDELGKHCAKSNKARYRKTNTI